MPAEIEAVFLDTDVVLDHLADRQPFSGIAHRLFGLAETGQIKLHVSALSFCNLYYLLRKSRGHDAAVGLLPKLALLVEISVVSDTQIRAALASGLKDFEDAVQYSSASALPKVMALITRNQRDFRPKHLPVQSADEYLASREVRKL